ncbi:hypothetical protein [Bacillus swezeyi]|nr:hypothetical protein [Bacillus swezeyi]
MNGVSINNLHKACDMLERNEYSAYTAVKALVFEVNHLDIF